MKAFRSPNGWAVELMDAENAIKAAVLAEREACAKVCDDYAAKCAANENWEAEDVSLTNAAAIRSLNGAGSSDQRSNNL